MEGSRRHTARSKKDLAFKPTNKKELPKRWQEVPGPLLAVPSSKSSNFHHSSKAKKRPQPFLSFLCCGTLDDADDPMPVTTRQQPSTNPEMEIVAVPPSVQRTSQAPRRDRRQRSSSVRPALADKTTNSTHRPPILRDPSSQTENLLALIPKSLTPQTTSQILAELAKPISAHDEEGYIYIFWLTPCGGDGTSTLLSASPTPSPRSRRASSTPRARAGLSPQPSNPSSPTIVLKIGRASNVQRRMNEWTRQCGYDLSLIRFYPYIPTFSPLPSPSSRRVSATPQTPTSAAPRKVPHAHRVERLIHLELADSRIKNNCGACGKEHREWFEVKGDRQGVKAVDEVIRRWVRWAEER
ncbi:MAG: hypothetical protein Q9181_008092 [Wetmoreana brouardii]